MLFMPWEKRFVIRGFSMSPMWGSSSRSRERRGSCPQANLAAPITDECSKPLQSTNCLSPALSLSLSFWTNCSERASLQPKCDQELTTSRPVIVFIALFPPFICSLIPAGRQRAFSPPVSTVCPR
jgi:hypothetical protein